MAECLFTKYEPVGAKFYKKDTTTPIKQCQYQNRMANKFSFSVIGNAADSYDLQFREPFLILTVLRILT